MTALLAAPSITISQPPHQMGARRRAQSRSCIGVVAHAPRRGEDWQGGAQKPTRSAKVQQGVRRRSLLGPRPSAKQGYDPFLSASAMAVHYIHTALEVALA